MKCNMPIPMSLPIDPDKMVTANNFPVANGRSANPGTTVRSMTGYAAVRSETSVGELTLGIRTVNHRGLDLHFHLGPEFSAFENDMRALLKREVARAHVEIRLHLARRQDLSAASFDRSLLSRYVDFFRQASQEFNLSGEPDLNVLVTLPGVFSEAQPPAEIPGDLGAELLRLLAACLAELNAHRAREGEALREELANQAAEIENRTREITAIRSEILPLFRQRLQDRLTELLGQSGIGETRLVEEAAMLAEKSDIQEELTRLAVHATELRRILEDGGEIGKRLDFLLQEMNRETNTALAKSAGAGEPGLRITNLGLALKANIDKIREQALNLE